VLHDLWVSRSEIGFIVAIISSLELRVFEKLTLDELTN
jgi:hypothetical protein